MLVNVNWVSRLLRISSIENWKVGHIQELPLLYLCLNFNLSIFFRRSLFTGVIFLQSYFGFRRIEVLQKFLVSVGTRISYQLIRETF